MPKTTANPLCPYCSEVMQYFTPLVFSGKGVDDYTCTNVDCPYVVEVQVRELKQGEVK